jgi:hypothetical protein
MAVYEKKIDVLMAGLHAQSSRFVHFSDARISDE